MLQPRPAGLYCPAGDFHVDPWRPVERALITHGHGDHARPGSSHYLTAAPGVALLRHRLGGADIEGARYGESIELGDVRVSFHPAGHILGSAQIRVEGRDSVWVVAGDYKRQRDPTCAPFEPLLCDTFVTEATFALPVFRWDEPGEVAAEIAAWHAGNRAQGRCSVLFCYALGKAQRLLAELAPHLDAPVWVHGALRPLVAIYRQQGIDLPAVEPVNDRGRDDWSGRLVMAPPSAAGSRWLRRFGAHRSAFVSGWMRIRGHRRRRGHDRGFVLSDHVDWPDLLATIEETGCRRVLATHGRSDVLVRYLRECRGLEAHSLTTDWQGEAGEP